MVKRHHNIKTSALGINLSKQYNIIFQTLIRQNSCIPRNADLDSTSIRTPQEPKPVNPQGCDNIYSMPVTKITHSAA